MKLFITKEKEHTDNSHMTHCLVLCDTLKVSYTVGQVTLI